VPLFLFLTLPAAGRSTPAPFSFLAARLWEQDADQAGFEQRVQLLNLRLREVCPELALRFRAKGKSLILDRARDADPLSSTRLSPAAQLTAQLASLALLHETIYRSQPIFLIDLIGLCLAPQEQAALLQVLRQTATRQQCLIAADNDFLSLCVDALGKTGTGEHPWMRLIDVP
jgi:hypothetical protein